MYGAAKGGSPLLFCFQLPKFSQGSGAQELSITAFWYLLSSSPPAMNSAAGKKGAEQQQQCSAPGLQSRIKALSSPACQHGLCLEPQLLCGSLSSCVDAAWPFSLLLNSVVGGGGKWQLCSAYAQFLHSRASQEL